MTVMFVDLAEASQNTAPACVANRSYVVTLLMSGVFGHAQPYFEQAMELFDP